MRKAKIRVLLIDDDLQFGQNAAAILERRGLEATAVGSGLEALDQIEKAAFDVAVLDVKMPELDGNEVLREIKRIRPNLPVIMLTGYGTMSSALDGLRAGVFDYLTKPCDMDLLAGRICDAHAKEKGLPQVERRARDIMVPLDSFSTIREDGTVADAVKIILRSFQDAINKPIQETVHRSILILNHGKEVIGVLSLADLLRGFQPPHPHPPATGDIGDESLSGRALGCAGMFTLMAREVARKKVRELMSKAPPTIDAEADLLESAGRLVTLDAPRLLVLEQDKPVGVLREQDLFFEIAKILGEITGQKEAE